MDICHLKNAELETKAPKNQGRVVLRGDIVKDNSGSYAVFTEQGSSASQMTAAKIMYIISRLPGCDGQAADAVSAYSQVKLEDAHKLFKIPKSESPDSWIRLPRHKWPKSCSSIEDRVVLLERNLYGHPLAGLLCERQCEKILLKYGWEKVSNWECLFVHREKGLFLSVYVDELKLAEKKQAKILWTMTEPCSNREFPRWELKNFHSLRIFVFHQGLMIWLVMQRNVWNDIVSWHTRRHNNTAKYLLHASMTTTSREKK